VVAAKKSCLVPVLKIREIGDRLRRAAGLLISLSLSSHRRISNRCARKHLRERVARKSNLIDSNSDLRKVPGSPYFGKALQLEVFKDEWISVRWSLILSQVDVCSSLTPYPAIIKKPFAIHAQYAAGATQICHHASGTSQEFDAGDVCWVIIEATQQFSQTHPHITIRQQNSGRCRSERAHGKNDTFETTTTVAICRLPVIVMCHNANYDTSKLFVLTHLMLTIKHKLETYSAYRQRMHDDSKRSQAYPGSQLPMLV
jgi:hypothetical protein